MANETKWTPGMWRVGMDQFVVDADEDVVCDVSRAEHSAIIAAAPDLYAALEAALPFLLEHSDEEDAALAALARARGEGV